MYESFESAVVPSLKQQENRRRRVSNSLFKKLIDLVVAMTAILFLSPALIVIAILIKLDSEGPVLFRQRRTGLDGKVFHIFKFRSMTVAEDGEKVIQAKANDQRVTRIGKILRRTSIDEIPQLFNIVKGDMSLVGPRPHAMSHDSEFAALVPAYPRRFLARPGLTGLAQVKGYRGEIHTREDLDRRVDYDLDYIENWTLARDIGIILMTVPCLFGHKKAY